MCIRDRHKHIQYTIKNVTLELSGLSVNSDNIFADVFPSSQVSDKMIVETYSMAMTYENIKNAVSMYIYPDWKEENCGPIEDWNTHAVTDMSYIFSNVNDFNEDISRWDTSNVKNMKSMFKGAEAFNKDISGWDTSSVTNMSHMFCNAEAFNQDISKKTIDKGDGTSYEAWNTGNVKNMKSMFHNAKAFNNGEMTNNGSKPLNWNTGNVQTMEGMFAVAVAFNQDVSSGNLNNLKSVSMMFYKAEAFNRKVGDWITPSLQYDLLMFDFERLGKEIENNNNVVPDWMDTRRWVGKIKKDRNFAMDPDRMLGRLLLDDAQVYGVVK